MRKKRVKVNRQEIFNGSTRKEVEKSKEDIKLGRNLSSIFKTVEEARTYLES